eukprot:gene14125-30071_t
MSKYYHPQLHTEVLHRTTSEIIPVKVVIDLSNIDSYWRRSTDRDDWPLLVDMIERCEPNTRGSSTVIFSSPYIKFFKDAVKDGGKVYIMPTWSEVELSHAVPPLTGGDNEYTWKSNFEMIEGVPRHIFNYDSNLSRVIQDALNNKGKVVSDHFFGRGVGGLDDDDDDVSYLLIHINPHETVDEDGMNKIEYRGMKNYSFASDYINKQISSR